METLLVDTQTAWEGLLDTTAPMLLDAAEIVATVGIAIFLFFMVIRLLKRQARGSA